MQHLILQSIRKRWMDSFIILVIFLTNLTAFTFWFSTWIFITAFQLKVPQAAMALLHGLLWVGVILILYFNIRKNGNLPAYISVVKELKLLVFFVIAAVFSIFWSINPWISAYKVIVLIGATLAGIYLGQKYTLARHLEILFWFFSIVLLFSTGLAIMQPGIGTLEGHPYFGAWCGVFWNRNHLASLAAFAVAVFLLRLVSMSIRQNRLFIADLLMFALSLLTIYKAGSATGYILTTLLMILIMAAFVWMKIRHKLKKTHYLILLGLLLLCIVLAFSQLDLLFRLMNRSSSLTGRVPMWGYLIQNVIGKSPWIGYGYGAVWSNGFFREGMHQAVDWPYPILIADNGYLDILLAIGLLGFLPFLLFVGNTFGKSIKQAVNSHFISEFFPAIFMLYVVVANISFSLFCEIETFIWMILVALHTGLRIKATNSPENQP